MIPSHRRRLLCARLLLSGLLAALSGCTLLQPPANDSEPVIAPQLPPNPKRLPPQVDRDTPAPRPAPAPVVEPEPAVPVEDRLEAAVILSSRADAYVDIANALVDELGPIDIYELTDKSLTPAEMVESIRSSGAEVVIAIGFRAATFAAGIEDVPVVVSQVFNVNDIDLQSGNVKGVSVLPPLDLQIEAWRAMNPNLSSIGAILGPGHELLLQEAEQTAAANGVRFQYRLAQSDRETLYLFTRLVPDIDGFWLFPDNRILSTTVLRQMLTYASRHRVQVAVFNDSLLSLGATISATSVDADVAETIVRVANRLLEKDVASMPNVTGLSEIEIRRSVSETVLSEADLGSEDVH